MDTQPGNRNSGLWALVILLGLIAGVGWYEFREWRLADAEEQAYWRQKDAEKTRREAMDRWEADFGKTAFGG